jgi:hypothetical protein
MKKTAGWGGLFWFWSLYFNFSENDQNSTPGKTGSGLRKQEIGQSKVTVGQGVGDRV